MRNIYKHWITHFLRLVITSGCSLGTGDWRIHHLPGRILRQMFGSLWLFFIQTNENPVIYDKLEYRQRDDWHQGRDFFFFLTKHGLEKMFEIILDCRVQNKITAFSLNLWAFVVNAYFSRLSIMNEHILWIVNNRVWARPHHCANPSLQLKLSLKKAAKGTICPLQNFGKKLERKHTRRDLVQYRNCKLKHNMESIF